jgi:hypothetical protein
MICLQCKTTYEPIKAGDRVAGWRKRCKCARANERKPQPKRYSVRDLVRDEVKR